MKLTICLAVYMVYLILQVAAGELRAQASAKPAPAPTTAISSAKPPEISDGQQRDIRARESDFWKAKANRIFWAGEEDRLQREVSEAYTALGGYCSAGNTAFNAEKLACVPKSPTQPSTVPTGGK